MMRIGEAAMFIGVTNARLHYLEKKGYITPVKYGRNRTRYYDETDLVNMKYRLAKEKEQIAINALVHIEDQRKYVLVEDRPRNVNGNLIYYKKKGFRNRMAPRPKIGRPRKKKRNGSK